MFILKWFFLYFLYFVNYPHSVKDLLASLCCIEKLPIWEKLTLLMCLDSGTDTTYFLSADKKKQTAIGGIL